MRPHRHHLGRTSGALRLAALAALGLLAATARAEPVGVSVARPEPSPPAEGPVAPADAPPPDEEAPEGGLPAWLDLWAELGGGVDGNPARAPGGAQPAEGFGWLLGRARARLGGERASAVFTLTEAARLYPGFRGADALASRLEVVARARLGGGVAAGFSGLAADTTERSGQLDRYLVRGEGSLALRLRSVQGSLAGAWFLFAPREPSLRPFRAEGPEGWLRLAWAVAEGHELSAAAGLSQAAFPDWAAAGAPGSPQRDDRTRLLSAGWSWRGPAILSLGWDHAANDSSAPGGDFTRHRLTAAGALRLPLDVTLATRLALQWTDYPDPLLLPAEQRLAEGREALDQLEARFTRALTGPLEVSLALAWYRVKAAEGVPGYERGVATLALGWRSRAVAP